MCDVPTATVSLFPRGNFSHLEDVIWSSRAEVCNYTHNNHTHCKIIAKLFLDYVAMAALIAVGWYLLFVKRPAATSFSVK